MIAMYRTNTAFVQYKVVHLCFVSVVPKFRVTSVMSHRSISNSEVVLIQSLTDFASDRAAFKHIASEAAMRGLSCDRIRVILSLSREAR